MCCNRPRQAATPGTQRITSRYSANTQPRAASSAPIRASFAPSSATFEYVGQTALTVVSPVTRKTYRFEQTGAKVEIDARDRSWVAFVPGLRPA